MRRKLLLVVLCLSVPGLVLAHLCNDVFIQAKDNLVIKVDVRDGQLRIGEKASFRVYLLNTMDRDIVDIRLGVLTEHFDAMVAHAPDWRRFPQLKAVRGGGKKQYFTVTLQRKPGVPDGKYGIDLHLYNGRNKSMVFKTVDMGKSAGICELPRAKSIRIDAKADRAEWGKSYLASDFYAYVKKGRYYENVPALVQSRFRVTCDDENLYCLLNFQTVVPASADVATIYVARTSVDPKPVAVSFDRISGEVTCEKGTEGVEIKTDAQKRLIECRIPRKLLGIADVTDEKGKKVKLKSCHMNFARTVTSDKKKKSVTYWRGNRYSVLNPIVYGQFKIAE